MLLPNFGVERCGTHVAKNRGNFVCSLTEIFSLYLQHACVGIANHP